MKLRDHALFLSVAHVAVVGGRVESTIAGDVDLFIHERLRRTDAQDRFFLNLSVLEDFRAGQNG